MSRTIVHVSTVHSAIDPRIRLKQLNAIASSGWDGKYISTDNQVSALGDSIHLLTLPSGNGSRTYRFFVADALAIIRALRVHAHTYHFHDPELLPWAWLLLIKRVPVVYDIHEDYSLSVRHKRYIPRLLRSSIAWIVAQLERALSLPFRHVIAEACYRSRFPRAIGIYNYPVTALARREPIVNPNSSSVLYTGNVTIDRGALNLARVVAASDDIAVTAVGRCDSRIATKMRQIVAGSCRPQATERLQIVGVQRFVPFEEITRYYAVRRWLAGVVLIPDSPHYREKHLTKFFEYMAVGLPVIATDVPAWRSLIVEQGVGLCVNPADPESVSSAIVWLQAHPRQAREMGRRGQELVSERYHWESQAEKLLSLYASLSSPQQGKVPNA